MPRDEQDRLITIKAFGGIDQSRDEGDTPISPVCYTHDCVNFRLRNGSIKVRGGVTDLSAYATVPVGLTVQLFSLSGRIYAFVDNGDTATTNIYSRLAYSPDGDWTARKGANTISTGTVFTSVIMSIAGVDTLILSNGVDPVYKINDDDAAISVLSASAPKGQWLAVHLKRLWISGQPAPNTRLVSWSAALDPTDFTITTDVNGPGAVNLNIPLGYTLAMRSMGNTIVIFTSKSVCEITGLTPIDFQLSEIPVASDYSLVLLSQTLHNGTLYFIPYSTGELMAYNGVSIGVPFVNKLQKYKFTMALGMMVRGESLIFIGGYNDRLLGGSRYVGFFEIDLKTGGITQLRSDTGLNSNFVFPFNATWVGKIIGGRTDGTAWQFNLDLEGADYLPEPGCQARYVIPSTDLGVPNATKRFVRLYITGSGGIAVFTPVCDGVNGAPVEVTLPATNQIVQAPIGGKGRLIGLIIENKDGSPIQINDLSFAFEADED